jgi:hypothetical protein
VFPIEAFPWLLVRMSHISFLRCCALTTIDNTRGMLCYRQPSPEAEFLGLRISFAILDIYSK